jgi:hypothetical protein
MRDVAGVIVAGVTAIWLAWSIYSGWPKREEADVSDGISYSIPQKKEAQISNGISYSNPQNNHDQQKQKHISQASAIAEARRMQARHGESERFVAYYNRELDAWYVGRGKVGF